MLRSKKSHVIGMIVPKYDNRYFGSVAENFEEMARERGLLPIITCTRRRPELEIEAVKAMLSGRWIGWWRPGRRTRIKLPSCVSRRGAYRESRSAGDACAVGYLGQLRRRPSADG